MKNHFSYLTNKITIPNQSFEEKYTHVRGLTQPEIDLIYRQNIMKNKMLSSFIDN